MFANIYDELIQLRQEVSFIRKCISASKIGVVSYEQNIQISRHEIGQL